MGEEVRACGWQLVGILKRNQIPFFSICNSEWICLGYQISVWNGRTHNWGKLQRKDREEYPLTEKGMKRMRVVLQFPFSVIPKDLMRPVWREQEVRE